MSETGSEPAITDCTDLGKVLIRAEPGAAHDAAPDVPPGRAIRDDDGVLAVRRAPDEWMLLMPPGMVASLLRRTETLGDQEFASVVDVTHGHALVRLTGAGAASALAKVCSIDMTDLATPGGAVARTLVAGIVATVIRDDEDAAPSYLVLCDRSYGRYLMDVLTDAAGP